MRTEMQVFRPNAAAAEGEDEGSNGIIRRIELAAAGVPAEIDSQL